MDTIRDNGQVFVKATALAKKYKYTTDYIGQLCRAGKVEAQLIGRAWFVVEESLMNHKNDRVSSTRSSEIVINKSLVSDKQNNLIQTRPVHSVIGKNVHRQVASNAMPISYNFLTKTGERTSTYHSDDNDLVPERRGNSVSGDSHKIGINNANNEVLNNEKTVILKVSVSEKKAKKLEFEPLPEIMLRGKLAISSLDSEDNFLVTEPVSEAEISFTPQSVGVTTSRATVVSRYSKEKRPEIKRFERNIPVENSQIEDFDNQSDLADVGGEQVEIISSAVYSSNGDKLSVLAFSRTAVFVCFLFSFIGFFLLLGLVSVMESNGVETRQSVIFNLAAVGEAFDRLTKSY